MKHEMTDHDLERMSWHARQRYYKRIRKELAELSDAPLEPDVFDEVLADEYQHAGPAVPVGPRRIRVYRLRPRLWEMSDGVNTVRAPSAEAAWSLIAKLRK
jgi:hypothetical protein